MGTRLELNEVLTGILGSRNVYFQPPENIKIKYPCIVYERMSNSVNYANDAIYKNIRQYKLTLIDQSPDSKFDDEIMKLPYCKFSTMFVKNNLNHYIYNLFY